MRLVIQRARRGRVSVGDRAVAAIGPGAVILVGVARGDTADEAGWLAEKTAQLRIYEDPDGKMNRSLVEVGGEALVVSQFTLLADTRKGRRPSFLDAADPTEAEPLVRAFAEGLTRWGVPAKLGEFGAHMLVEIENDGPVTIVLERGRQLNDDDARSA
ncbi:MAG TPA: D-aminoacyl-tRNA deacylase [Anaerolineales bacterium]|nr:D-aminoacyl-tRNA deacylase [Anaerolineales bacterium]